MPASIPASIPAAIPAWVPVLFLGLAFLGYRLSRPSTVKPLVVTTVALALAGLSFYGVVGTFGLQPFALAAWAAGYALALPFGVRHFVSRGMLPAGESVHVGGSWLPMALMLGIFVTKFALGMAAGLQLAVLQQPGFVMAMSALLGALSGGFGSRALAVLRFAAGRRVG